MDWVKICIFHSNLPRHVLDLWLRNNNVGISSRSEMLYATGWEKGSLVTKHLGIEGFGIRFARFRDDDALKIGGFSELTTRLEMVFDGW